MYPIDSLCKLFGVTKQAYYKHNEDVILLKVAQEIFVLQYIHEIRKKDPGIGGMKLWYMYQKVFGNSNPVGRYSFENIVDRYGLKVRKRVRMPNTTDSTHGLPVYPNAIKDFVPEAPNQLWVSDITYIPVWFNESEYNFSYLSLILDAYTEEIIGWSVGSTLEAVYPIEALKMALKRIKGQENHQLIHHSDRGCQYASNEYVSILKEHKIRISMTESGNPKDNAQAERINSTMKNELLKGKIFRNVKEVKAAVNVAIDFYNNERPHMSVDMLTPAQATNCTGEIEKKWKSYRLIAIKSRLDGLNIAGNGLPSFAC
jgi:putative transposase